MIVYNCVVNAVGFSYKYTNRHQVIFIRFFIMFNVPNQFCQNESNSWDRSAQLLLFNLVAFLVGNITIILPYRNLQYSTCYTFM